VNVAPSRTERWRREKTGETHWRPISRDTVTTPGGRDNESRIRAPPVPGTGGAKRIFSWLALHGHNRSLTPEEHSSAMLPK
jgi:hypothetical protein